MDLKQTLENIDTDQLRADAAVLAGNVAEQVGKAYGDARTRVVEDYLPRAQRAAEAAREAAATPVAVAAVAAAPKPVKRHRGLKCLGWLALAGAAAGAAYVVWRRSQPVEDPWAEEYWADSTGDTESTEN